MILSKLSLADKFRGLEGSGAFWMELNALTQKYDPVNLGMGNSNYNAAPPGILSSLMEIVNHNHLNQYTRPMGHPRLVRALAELYSRVTQRRIEAMTEVLVTSGAYEALFITLMSHVNPGDEVIIIEPFFEAYKTMCQVLGATPVFVPLRLSPEHNYPAHSNDLVLDWEELASKFNPKTKAIIVNTPHNPTGKVFSYEELTKIADLCKEHDVLVIMDEVYEWMTYIGAEHIRMITIPGMWERTITIGSAAKTFNVTGWRIGWAYGPANLIKNLFQAHHCVISICPTPLQEAVAIGLEQETALLNSPGSYFKKMRVELQRKRDFMTLFLNAAGFDPIVPDGSYFFVANWTKLKSKIDLSNETGTEEDVKFCKWLTKNYRLQTLPNSLFYSAEHKKIGEDCIRLCFIKTDLLLEEASEILRKLKKDTIKSV